MSCLHHRPTHLTSITRGTCDTKTVNQGRLPHRRSVSCPSLHSRLCFHSDVENPCRHHQPFRSYSMSHFTHVLPCFLQVHVSSTMGKGVVVDTATVNPSHSRFMLVDPADASALFGSAPASARSPMTASGATGGDIEAQEEGVKASL